MTDFDKIFLTAWAFGAAFGWSLALLIVTLLRIAALSREKGESK